MLAHFKDMCSLQAAYCSAVSHVTNSHYSDVIMSATASQITNLTIVYSTVYSGADQRKHQSSASLAFVRGIHRSPVDSPHKGLVTRKCFISWRHHDYALIIVLSIDEVLYRRWLYRYSFDTCFLWARIRQRVSCYCVDKYNHTLFLRKGNISVAISWCEENSHCLSFRANKLKHYPIHWFGKIAVTSCERHGDSNIGISTVCSTVCSGRKKWQLCIDGHL